MASQKEGLERRITPRPLVRKRPSVDLGELELLVNERESLLEVYTMEAK